MAACSGSNRTLCAECTYIPSFCCLFSSVVSLARMGAPSSLQRVPRSHAWGQIFTCVPSMTECSWCLENHIPSFPTEETFGTSAFSLLHSLRTMSPGLLTSLACPSSGTEGDRGRETSSPDKCQPYLDSQHPPAYSPFCTSCLLKRSRTAQVSIGRENRLNLKRLLGIPTHITSHCHPGYQWCTSSNKKTNN